jgi:hypothetical protein
MSVFSSMFPHEGAMPILPGYTLNDTVMLGACGSIKLRFRESDFPGLHKHYLKVKNGIITLPFRDLMFCSGLMQSPSRSAQSQTAWGFLAEHFESICVDDNGILCYFDFAEEWDPRLKAIFSERLACGLAAWCLWNLDDVIHIADVGDFFRKQYHDSSGFYNGKALSNLKRHGKNGDWRPDYFCLTSNSEAVIVECKGAMGPPSVLAGAIRKGKKQVSNVKPTGVTSRLTGGQLVFASNFRGIHERVRAGCESAVNVVDPEFAEDAEVIEISPDEIAINAYCKILDALGVRRLSRDLLAGERFAQNQVLENQLILDDRVKIFYCGENSHSIYGLDMRVAIALLASPLRGLAARVREIDIVPSTSDEGLESVMILRNGVVRIDKPVDDDVDFFAGALF